MGHEKLVHSLTRVGPLRIRVDTTGTAAGPGMPHLIDFPIGDPIAAVGVLPCEHGVGSFSLRPSRAKRGTARMLKACRKGTMGSQLIRAEPLPDDLLAVDGVGDQINSPMKDDGWYHPCEGTHLLKGFLSLLDGIGPGGNPRKEPQ